jgi:hypothetical protein
VSKDTEICECKNYLTGRTHWKCRFINNHANARLMFEPMAVVVVVPMVLVVLVVSVKSPLTQLEPPLPILAGVTFLSQLFCLIQLIFFQFFINTSVIYNVNILQTNGLYLLNI